MASAAHIVDLLLAEGVCKYTRLRRVGIALNRRFGSVKNGLHRPTYILLEYRYAIHIPIFSKNSEFPLFCTIIPLLCYSRSEKELRRE